MTSSEELVEAVAKLFVWTKDGFPNALPGGMSSMLLDLLRGHLQSFDAKGIEVKFWKVAPEFITGMQAPKLQALSLFGDRSLFLCREPAARLLQCSQHRHR